MRLSKVPEVFCLTFAPFLGFVQLARHRHGRGFVEANTLGQTQCRPCFFFGSCQSFHSCKLNCHIPMKIQALLVSRLFLSECPTRAMACIWLMSVL